MENMSNQPPDLHDLLNIEEDPAVDPSKRSSTPVSHPQNDEILTPAKVLMVGEPVMVKTEPQDIVDTVTSGVDTSGSSTDELPDGINSPSPGTAAAMESLIEHDDYTTGSPRLNEMSNFPVNFTTSTISKIIVKPQTSIMASIRTSQPLSIAGKKFTVKQGMQPVQVVKREGGGGPIVTKYIVKRNSTSAAVAQKSQVVLAKGNRNLVHSQVKASNLQSGSILLSPIKGGFKIPISPMKSPIKVSVFPPKKTSMSEKQQIISIQSAQMPLKTQSTSINNSTTSVNGIVAPGKNDTIQQKHLAFSPRMDGGVKYQYVQIVSPGNSNQQTTLRSNQGQPITFTSMAQLNGGDITLSQPSGSLTLLQPTIQKFQPQQHNVTLQRKAQTVKVTIPNQSNQMKPQQRLIMPATTSLHPIRPNLSSLAPGSVIPAGNVGYAMVPAKYVEQLTKQLNSQASFVQDNPGQSLQKNTSLKPGGDGKLKKPCNCTKSQCLKLYCECFANGQFCDECNCTNCYNNLKHEADRSKAIRQCLERNPAAFRPKIGRGKDDNRTHQKGCNCKRSGCLKNYCECYEARIPCTSKCKCIGCKNYEESNDRRSLMSLADAAEVRVQQQTAASTKLSNQIGDIRPNTRISSSGERLPYTFFTQEVIEATCTCLLAQAEEAEKTNRPLAIAESMILEEFGRCLMQIIQSAGKAKVMHSQ